MQPMDVEVACEVEAYWLAESLFQLEGSETRQGQESEEMDLLVTFQACELLEKDQTLEETLANSLHVGWVTSWCTEN